MNRESRECREQLAEFAGYLLNTLTHQKADILDRIAPKADPAYREEWMQRDPLRFWGHLDMRNQRAVVDMVLEEMGE